MPQSMRQLSSEEFPPLLSEIPDPPDTLYLRGTLPSADTTLLAIVGSRKYTQYGAEACKSLINGLRGTPISIVSGLALGIDSIAHETALNAGLHTIAIPGSGLNDEVLYPASHRQLAHRILDTGGALLSEFPPDAKARPEYFPQRNRIMAGMTHATLVIEATQRSGTLITARLATEYNRDVLTVPGSIFSSSTHGPHMLIRMGAVPITTSADIIDALHIEQETGTAIDDMNVTKEEKEILAILTEPCTRDEVIRRLSCTTSEAQILLSTMEMKGLIAESYGKIRKNV